MSESIEYYRWCFEQAWDEGRGIDSGPVPHNSNRYRITVSDGDQRKWEMSVEEGFVDV